MEHVRMSDPTTVRSASRLDEEFLRGLSARWEAAWNSHDHHQVAALCTDDVECVDPTVPTLGRGAGASATQMKAVLRWRFTGTMTGPLSPPGFGRTGRHMEIRGYDDLEFRGELVCRVEGVYDVNAVGVRWAPCRRQEAPANAWPWRSSAYRPRGCDGPARADPAAAPRATTRRETRKSAGPPAALEGSGTYKHTRTRMQRSGPCITVALALVEHRRWVLVSSLSRRQELCLDELGGLSS
jgi:hypothetical protein